MGREARANPNRTRGELRELPPEPAPVEPPPLPGAVPIERDDGADEAALREMVEGRWREIIEAPLPEQNVFLHGYRQSDDAQLARMRRLKDVALVLWQEMHEADGSKPDLATPFNSREMGLASLRLEEAMLWVEKHFNV
jgi:hypothetical protein